MRLLRKFELVPVTNPGQINFPLDITGKELFWGKENSIVEHDSFLINTFHSKNKIFNRKEYGIRDDVIIMADSGGLQNFRIEQGIIKSENETKLLNPREVIDWQEQSADIGFILDKIPPTGRFGIDTCSHEKFIECAKQTKANTEIMFQYKDNKEFRLYGIIHGKDYDTLKTWYDITKDDRLAGYGIGCGSSPLSFVIPILFAYENVDKPIHFLGVGGLERSILPLYFSKFFKYPITCDSSIFITGQMYRQFYLPTVLNKSIHYPSSKEKVSMKRFACNCPVCKSIEFESIFDTTNNKINDIKFTLHNLYVFKEYFHTLETLLDDKKSFMSVINAHFSDDVKLAFEMLDYGIEYGSQKMLHKYASKLTIAPPQITTTKSLLNW